MIQASSEAINAALSILLQDVDATVEAYRSEGQSELDHYDTRALALLNSAKALLLRTVSHVSKLNEERNALAPIHRLPTELLIDIFQRALPAQREMDFVGPRGDTPTFYVFLGDLMSVCKRWRAIVDAQPSLWNYVSVYAHPRFNVRALSSNVPLTVDCSTLPTSHNVHKKRGKLSMPEVKLFAEATEAHVGRWSVVRVVLNDPIGFEHLRTALQYPAPSLKKLEISGEMQKINPVAIDLFAGDFPRLEILSIAHASVRLAPSSLTYVTTLSLFDIPQDALSLQHLLLLLRSCTQLRSLALLLLVLEDEVEAEVAEFHNLRHLSSLKLNWLSDSATQLLLSRIPSLQSANHLSVAFLSIGNAVQDVLQSIRSFLPAIRRIFEETYAAKQYTIISVTDLGSVSITSKTSLFTEDDAFGCDISLPDVLPSPVPVFDFIREIVSSCSVKISLSLDLHGGSGWTETDYLRPLADMNFESLCISESDGIDQRALFEYLGTPLATDDRVFWPFPNLRYIDISIPHLDVTLFSGMLRRRYGADAPMVWSQRPLHQSARLERMDIWEYKMTASDMEELRASLAGDVAFKIHKPIFYGEEEREDDVMTNEGSSSSSESSNGDVGEIDGNGED